ncbi:MAG: glycosyltransferase family 2 protein [Parcubacteria group bacterium]|nr:glycosyltransferase family 2 protein [Parcubacteria group bacterium]MCR4342526.1 glycosyltransferase family 2 protein [Patescibacteria group bacterium]
MMTKLSIIVPAYNEERGLALAVNSLFSLLSENNMASDAEILIFNDCSLDKTGEIANDLAKNINIVKVFHNKKNMGLGFNFREGARQSKGEYVTWFPGDNENLPQSFVDTVSRIGEADIIIPYTDNMEVRPFLRRLVSRLYTDLNNFLFRLHLKYYNGLSVYRRDLLLSVLPKIGDSFAFSAQILIMLLKSGASFVEVPIKIQSKPGGKSSAFRMKNIIGVIKAILSLFWRINIKRERVKI